MHLTKLALLLLSAALSLGLRSGIEEPWETCHAPLLTDAEAIAQWEAQRTANNWGPNWSGATPLPARSDLTIFTQSANTPAPNTGEPEYALSNSRAIYLFDQYGRLRGGMDRSRGVEIVRNDGSGAAAPYAFNGVTWVIGWGPANSPTQTSGWGISTFPVPTVTEISTPTGDGIRVVHFRDDLTLTTEYWLDGEALVALPKSITGTHTSGMGLHYVSFFLPGLVYTSGIQDFYVPGFSDGYEVLNLTDGNDDNDVYDPEINGRGATSGWTGNWLGFMIDRRFGVYTAVEDPNGYPIQGFVVRTLDQSNGFNYGFTFFSQDYGESPINWTGPAPIVIRPFCSEMGYAAIAKLYRRFALKHDWSHPPVPMKNRTDAIAASDLWGAINTGAAADASAIRDAGCSDAPGSPNPCGRATIDNYADELPGLRIAYWYALWASEPLNMGSFNHPKALPKANAASVQAGMLSAFPTYEPCPYWNAHSIDLSSLYGPVNFPDAANDSRCGQQGDPGDGVNTGIFSTSHHADDIASIVLQGATKWPHHIEPCNISNPTNCHHQGYFGQEGGVCVVEGSPAYSAFFNYKVNNFAQSVVTVNPTCAYLDVAPLTSPARFDATDADKGYKLTAFNDARRYYEAIGDLITDGPYALTREHGPDYANRELPSIQNWSQVTYDAAKGNVQRVPLWSLVYHDWIAGNGIMIHGDESPQANKIKLARALVFGQFPMLSWSHLDMYDDAVPGAADGHAESRIKHFAASRRQLKKYLVDGELLGAIEYATSPASDTEAFAEWCNGGSNDNCAGNKVAGSAPSVQGGWWRGTDNSYALVIANADPSNASTAYIVPPPFFRSATRESCLPSETRGACAAHSVTIEAADRWRIDLAAGAVRVIYLDGPPGLP